MKKERAAPKYLTSDGITGTIAQEKMSSSTDVGLQNQWKLILNTNVVPSHT